MRIGYPCLNWTIGCKGASTFRLKSYSKERLIEAVENNLACLEEMLRFNADKGILFFRITSDLVPFASHPVCTYNWQRRFRPTFEMVGALIRKHRIRISMHPDQFTLINSLDTGIFKRSHDELRYHAAVLDLMKLDATAKIQIHVGGVYGDREASMRRFVERYRTLDRAVARRLAVENDDTCYTLHDCLAIHKRIGIPVIFDSFHHSVNSSGEKEGEAVRLAGKTWAQKDGILMVDYSSQKKGAKPGTHTESIELPLFRKFLRETRPHDFDIMLEIKDKESSALKAITVLDKDNRFIRTNKEVRS